jgi:penicillin amidase
LYLTRAYTAQRTGAAASLDAIARCCTATSVEAAQQVVRNVSISCNWIIADRHGNIGYQQSGLAPVRRGSGLFPLPAWDEETAWRGTVLTDRLSSLLNPEEGFIVTANDNWNQPGKPQNINLSMGPERADRVRELIREREQLSAQDMQRIQTDLLSRQARRYMAALRPLIPDTPTGRLLREWDLRYNAASRGAVLFESFYEELLREVFGRGLFGADVWETLVQTTSLVTTYFHTLDEVIFGDDESWFGDETREELFRRLVTEVVSRPVEAVGRWGAERRVVMVNILLDGAVPRFLGRWLGIHRGPVELQGSRSTVVQGAIFSSHGRLSTFVPSYRMVADLGTDESHTVLAGGPSGRPFSKWYASDVKRWLDFEYKTLRGENGNSPHA